ncbi:MAG: hypothetical protein WBA10_04245 [Elainellaceae cyanobacterium]
MSSAEGDRLYGSSLATSQATVAYRTPPRIYKIVFASANDDDAQTWLLEDEYEPIEGRLPAVE